MLRILKEIMPRRNFWTPLEDRDEKLNQAKVLLCRTAMKAARRKGYTRKQMAIYMGTTKSNVSLIENQRVERLTFNQLFRYLVNLEAKFELLISI